MIATKLIRYGVTKNALLFRKCLNSFAVNAVTCTKEYNKKMDISTDVIQCSNTAHLSSVILLQKRFYTDVHRKDISFKFEKSKQILSENIENRKNQLRETRKIIVQDIRNKKTKVQEKVKEIEEIVDRENILTVPNLLCVGRSFLAPYIGYIIVQENYQFAIGLLVVAGISDLVYQPFQLK